MSKKTSPTPSKPARGKAKASTEAAPKSELDQVLAKFVKYVPAQLLAK
jgi:hypothetical protein